MPIPGSGDQDSVILADVTCQPKYSKPPCSEVFYVEESWSLRSDVKNVMCNIYYPIGFQ